MATDFATELARIAERFRNIQASDVAAGHRETKLLGVSAAKAIKRAVESNALTLDNMEGEPWPIINRPSDADELWSLCWFGLCSYFAMSFADRLPQNVNRTAIEFRGKPVERSWIETHRLRAADWSSRADQYAELCELIANVCVANHAAYLGGGRIRIGERVEVFTAGSDVKFIEYLVDHGKAMTPELQKAVSNPSETARKVGDAYDGFLKPFLNSPQGKRNAGYSLRIRDCRKNTSQN